ncbi:MAG: CocE/NonD family hydrolase [Pseudomonadota bacterium]
MSSVRTASAVPERYLPATEGLAPIPRPGGSYTWTEQAGVDVPMRDGIVLKTDLYLPQGLQAAPLILVRTPYNSLNFHPDRSGAGTVQFLVEHGYAVAVQNTRSKYGSGGERFVPSIKDDTDTYDTMEWVTRQSWYAGGIGTIGCSYLGESQVIAARDPHPAWKAAIPMGSGGANFNVGGLDRPFALWNGGALELAQALSWFVDHGEPTARPNTDADKFTMMKSLPLISALEAAGYSGTEYEEFASEPPTASDYWDRYPYLREGETIKVPSLFVEGWYDYGPHDVALQFEAARAYNGVPENAHRLIISPSTHCTELDLTGDTVIGELGLGDPRYDFRQLYLDWFDHHLRGQGPGLSSIPVVQTYLMGDNRWQAHVAWPPPKSAPQSLYLSPAGTLEKTVPDQGTVTFTYDPFDPVPTVGSPVCCVPEIDGQAPEGAFDQAPLDERNDILRFQTAPLSEDLNVSGPVEVVLYVSSDAPDTDFTAKLIDVHPNGKAYNILDGIQRMRWRERGRKPAFMEPGTVYEVRIHLQATSNLFKQGHRLRLDVSSSNFPRFDRNMNVRTAPALAAEGQSARNTVHISDKYPSRLIVQAAR